MVACVANVCLHTKHATVKCSCMHGQELRIEPLAKIDREAKHFAVASDQKYSVYLTGGGTGADYDESISKVSRLDTEANQIG